VCGELSEGGILGRDCSLARADCQAFLSELRIVSESSNRSWKRYAYRSLVAVLVDALDGLERPAGELHRLGAELFLVQDHDHVLLHGVLVERTELVLVVPEAAVLAEAHMDVRVLAGRK
jgi:hypothetical protein